MDENLKNYALGIICLIFICIIIYVYYNSHNENNESCIEGFANNNNSIVFEFYNRKSSNHNGFRNSNIYIQDIHVIQQNRKGKNKSFINLTSSKYFDGMYSSGRVMHPVQLFMKYDPSSRSRREGFQMINTEDTTAVSDIPNIYDLNSFGSPYMSQEERMAEYVSDSDDSESESDYENDDNWVSRIKNLIMGDKEDSDDEYSSDEDIEDDTDSESDDEDDDIINNWISNIKDFFWKDDDNIIETKRGKRRKRKRKRGGKKRRKRGKKNNKKRNRLRRRRLLKRRLRTIKTKEGDILENPQLFMVRDHRYKSKRFTLFALDKNHLYHNVLNKAAISDDFTFRSNNDFYGNKVLKNKDNIIRMVGKQMRGRNRNYIYIIDKMNGELKVIDKTSTKIPNKEQNIYIQSFRKVNRIMNVTGNQEKIKSLEKKKEIIKPLSDNYNHSIDFNIDRTSFLSLYNQLKFKTKLNAKDKMLAVVQLVFNDAKSLKEYIDSLYGFHVGKTFIDRSKTSEESVGTDAKFLLLFNTKVFKMVELKKWLRNHYGKTEKDLNDYCILGYKI